MPRSGEGTRGIQMTGLSKPVRRPKMKHYGIFTEREDGIQECVSTVDAISAPEAHRIYARRLVAEKSKTSGPRRKATP